jgi:hypothetical protein
MFNALSGLGAGGTMGTNVALVDTTNAALYGCFAIVGFFAGTFTNTVGVKYTLTVKYHNDSFLVRTLTLNLSLTLFVYKKKRLDLLDMPFTQPLSGFLIVRRYRALLLQPVLFLAAVQVFSGLPKAPS